MRNKVIPDSVIYFAALPDEASVNQKTVEILFDCSASTVWRRVKTGLLPAPTKYGSSTRWQVGALRQYLNKKEE